MDIKTSSNHITITGNIKSVSDFQNIKNAVDAMAAQNRVLHINITDSLSITSSVIGYFNKLILKDGIELNLNVGNDQLLDLLDDLNLIITFRARKV